MTVFRRFITVGLLEFADLRLYLMHRLARLRFPRSDAVCRPDLSRAVICVHNMTYLFPLISGRKNEYVSSHLVISSLKLLSSSIALFMKLLSTYLL